MLDSKAQGWIFRVARVSKMRSLPVASLHAANKISKSICSACKWQQNKEEPGNRCTPRHGGFHTGVLSPLQWLRKEYLSSSPTS